MTLVRLSALAALALMVSACVTAPSPSEYRAPEPLKPIDAERLYSGRWLEVARLPMSITDGCVAGASNYTLVNETRVDVLDTCQVDTPDGREKAIGGRGEILDPGTNTRLRVRYVAGFITWDYWILDHDPDYRWFIASDPKLKRIFLYTREVPGQQERSRLVERAKALGYDTENMEFPATR